MTDATDISEQTTAAATGLAFWLLGPLTATRSGHQLHLGGRQQQAVLACLLIEAGRTVSRSRLSEELWGEHVPRGAATTIQTYVSHLRDVLEPGRDQHERPSVLVTGNGGYRLDVDPSRIDSLVFRRRAERGLSRLRTGDTDDVAAAAAELRETLATWRGDALSNLVEYRFAEEEATRLHELRLAASEALADADLRLGWHAEVVGTLLPLVAVNPLRERLHEQLMLALYRSGRQAEALEVHRRLVTRLAGELGVDPSPSVEALHLAILRHDPALDPPAVPSPADAPAVPPPAAAPREARSPSEPPAASTWRSRGRLRALAGAVAVLAALAALVATATLQPWSGRAPPLTVAANTVSELDDSGAISASVPVGTNPIAVAAAADGAAWVANASDDSVSKIDPASHDVQLVVDVGDDPRSLAVTGHDLWAANYADNTVSRINTQAGKVVDTIEVGSGPAAVAAGQAGLWVANSGDNTIQRIESTSGHARRAVDVEDGPDGLAVDAMSVWVANGRAGSVTRVDARTGDEMSAPIRVGSGPRGIVRVGDDVWVANELSQNVTRIDVETGQTNTVDVGDGPTAVVADGGDVWVAERYSGDLFRIDPDSGRKTRFDVGGDPRGLAVVGGRLWVTSGASTTTGHQGGTVRVAAGDLPGRFTGLDPAAVYDVAAAHAERVVYDGLLAYNYTQTAPQALVPDLATSVPEPTDGGRTYTFNLRKGIRYSTGRPVRASDLRRGVERARLVSANGRPDFYAGIVGAQACIHDKTPCDLRRGVVTDDASGRVTFHLRAPDPQFLHKLTLLVVPAPAGTPLGKLRSPLPSTGPYRITSYPRHKRLVLTRNRYFREWSAAAQPAGFPDRITWVKVSDARAAADAVRAGRADLAELTPLGVSGKTGGPLVDALRVQLPTRVHRTVLQEVSFGVLNSSTPPFDRLQARRAVNYAIDRTEVVRLLGGPSVQIETCQLIPPSVPSYTPYCPYTLGTKDGSYRGPDLAKARRLVKASGTYGARVVVADVVGDYNPPLETYLARVLRRIGYRATVHRLSYTQRNEEYFYHPDSGIQVETGGWFADFPLPSSFYDVVSCAGESPSGYCNPDLDRRATRATEMLESDPGDALRTWTRIDRDVTDQAVLVPLTNLVDWWLTSRRVGNYQSGGRDIGPLLSQLWVR